MYGDAFALITPVVKGKNKKVAIEVPRSHIHVSRIQCPITAIADWNAHLAFGYKHTGVQPFDLLHAFDVFNGKVFGYGHVTGIAEIKLPDTATFLKGLIDVIYQLPVTCLAAIGAHVVLADANALIV